MSSPGLRVDVPNGCRIRSGFAERTPGDRLELKTGGCRLEAARHTQLVLRIETLSFLRTRPGTVERVQWASIRDVTVRSSQIH